MANRDDSKRRQAGKPSADGRVKAVTEAVDGSAPEPPVVRLEIYAAQVPLKKNDQVPTDARAQAEYRTPNEALRGRAAHQPGRAGREPGGPPASVPRA